MRSNSNLFLVIFSLAFSCSVFAQDIQNFEGSWTLDRDKTEAIENSNIVSWKIKVFQPSSTLSYESRVNHKGKPDDTMSSISFPLDGGKHVAKTSYSDLARFGKTLTDNSVVLTTNRTLRMGNRTTLFNVIETWTLSNSGNMLTIDWASETLRISGAEKIRSRTEKHLLVFTRD